MFFVIMCYLFFGIEKRFEGLQSKIYFTHLLAVTMSVYMMVGLIHVVYMRIERFFIPLVDRGVTYIICKERIEKYDL